MNEKVQPSKAQNAVASLPVLQGVLQRAVITPVAHGVLQRCSNGVECAECRAKREQREGTLQRAAVNAVPAPAVSPIVHDVLNSPGQPLDAGTRSFMEPRFGYDFSGVRVHTDARAAESARSVNALAYTVGRNVVFGTGQYMPGTMTGNRLLAHELTHVVQQSEASPFASRLLTIDPNPEHEREAQQIARSAQAMRIGLRRQALQRAPAPSTSALPVVDPETIPPIWRANPLPLSGGKDVFVYRGVARNALQRLSEVLRESDIGGTLSRNIDAAHDAIFNYVGRDPVLTGPESGGVIRVRISAALWDELVKTNSVSERGYPGFSRQLQSTEIRVNSPQAAQAINNLPKDVIPPDPYYDFRSGAARPPKPQAVEAPPEAARPTPSQGTQPTTTPETTTKPQSGSGGTPQNQGSAGAPTEFQVGTKFQVLSSVRKAGSIVSEIEVVFTEGLEAVNRSAIANGGKTLPVRMVIRITLNPEGVLTAVESLTGESSALAETVARQAVASIPRAVAGAEGATGAAAGTEGAASATGSSLARGIGWAGLVVFVVITGYQYKKATPEQRPRVLVTAGGGLAGGMLSGYLVCNLIFGIETFGWSLLGCAFLVGIPGGMLGSAAAGGIYDAAKATPLERALHDLQAQPVNVRKLFYTMVAQSSTSGGLAINEEFVRGFISTVPTSLRDDELVTLANQLGSIGSADTLQTILTKLRNAIDQLPNRKPILLPSVLDITEGPPGGRFRIDATGGQRIRILPPMTEPAPGALPEQNRPVQTIIEIQL